MKKVTEFFKGKKTYFVALGVAITSAAMYLGWIDGESAVVIYGLLGAGGLASLRAATTAK